MKSATALPTVEACDEALNALAELFDALPASHRPLHAGNREDVRRLLERFRRYVISQEAQAGEAKSVPRSPLSAPSSPDEPKRTKAEAKKAMATIKEIFDAIMALEFDVDREQLFDRLLEVCCPRCGAKVAPDDEHDCPNAPDDDDDDDDEDEEEEEDDESDAEPEAGETLT